jgi:hypothetical protein
LLLGAEVLVESCPEKFFGLLVEGNERQPAASFGSEDAISLVEEKLAKGGEEERAEPALLGIRPAPEIFFQQFGEKGLGEVLPFLATMALAADIGVKGGPVGAAEFLERFGRLRRIGLPCG